MSSPPQPEVGPADDFMVEQGAEFAIYHDTANEPPHAADHEDSSESPNVLHELPVPPPPYEQVSEPLGDTEAMEIYDMAQQYQRITYLLRESLAGRSPTFTEAEINLARGYMCSTTRDNLAAVQVDGEYFFAQYNQALEFFRTAVNGAQAYWEHVLSDDEYRSHTTASPVIEFLLVTHVLFPRLQGLINFMYSLEGEQA
ncbi:hypothetical protein ISF_09731 [Cordyceps fumosorosea ARSEF 2679]|uniref:Uncharacterized protein n=1 Tax=Cordyceps fumosorosea (strain ARSEF 2679) TaxID=1081104 RepID=A0A167DEP4_CORFA|nr:hypothetical protein ISF_09731 [Cordyceps fumosorosea ARSEF 2679]OAA42291.1 hypothetical protein ISF_09731 [Cordyceps fumosorosea ARSEF 2679]